MGNADPQRVSFVIVKESDRARNAREFLARALEEEQWFDQAVILVDDPKIEVDLMKYVGGIGRVVTREFPLYGDFRTEIIKNALLEMQANMASMTGVSVS